MIPCSVSTYPEYTSNMLKRGIQYMCECERRWKVITAILFLNQDRIWENGQLKLSKINVKH